MSAYARSLDGVLYCPRCAPYVGATLPAVALFGRLGTCYRCGARTLLAREWAS